MKTKSGKKRFSLIPSQWWNPWAWMNARKQEEVLNWYYDSNEFKKKLDKLMEEL